ncbi:hypothetical protein KQH65_12050, partial [archaeon]|nr:hypothetical protein [archaeon]
MTKNTYSKNYHTGAYLPCILNTVGILVIGNEILDGVILDTNTQWLIQQLKPLNYTVAETITVRDNTTE